jgi:protein O-mannosyl-transferase
MRKRAASQEPKAMSPPAPQTGSPPRWLLLALLVAVVLAYSNSLSVPWHYDDENTIVESEKVHDLSAAFADIGRGTRSLVHFTFAVNYALGGSDPWGYHLVNLAIHALAALMLNAWLRRVLGPQGAWPAFLAALCFAVHPLTTQSVTYVVQRYSSLCGLFFFASLWAWAWYRESGRSWWLALAILAAFLAMQCKEMAAVIPLVLVAADFSLHREALRRLRAERRWWWRDYLLLLVLLLVVPATSLLTKARAAEDLESALNWASGTNITREAYFLSELRIVAFTYLRLMLFPWGQCVDSPFSYVASPADGPTLAAALLLLALLVGAGWLTFRGVTLERRLLGFGGLLFFLGQHGIRSGAAGLRQPGRDGAGRYALALPADSTADYPRNCFLCMGGHAGHAHLRAQPSLANAAGPMAGRLGPKSVQRPRTLQPGPSIGRRG